MFLFWNKYDPTGSCIDLIEGVPNTTKKTTDESNTLTRVSEKAGSDSSGVIQYSYSLQQI